MKVFWHQKLKYKTTVIQNSEMIKTHSIFKEKVIVVKIRMYECIHLSGEPVNNKLNSTIRGLNVPQYNS